jgi:hypothetical protein
MEKYTITEKMIRLNRMDPDRLLKFSFHYRLKGHRDVVNSFKMVARKSQ